MARRRLIIKLSDKEQEQLNYLSGVLKIAPDRFLASVIQVHYVELNRMLDEQLQAKPVDTINHKP